MFSGKSSELLRRLRRQTIAGRPAVCYKFAADTRYSAADCATHDLLTFAAVPLYDLDTDLVDSLAPRTLIGIDEGQFFAGLAQFACYAAAAGHAVVVAALDGDSEQQPFAEIPGLVAAADTVCKLSAVCGVCGDTAPFTRRRPAAGQDQAMPRPRIAIGGSEQYQAVCRRCLGGH